MIDVGELYEQHAHQVAGFVRGRMTGTAAMDADDVAQNVWERAIKAAPSYRPDSHPMAWLLTIARNLVTDYYRASAWKLRAGAVPADVLLEEHHPVSIDRYRVEDHHILDAVQQLKPDQRDVVMLRYWEDRSFAETGAMLGVSEDGCKKRVASAWRNLRTMLEGAA